MLALYVSQYVYRSENEPVYEVPPERYAAEDIRILFNPKIDKQRVCKQRPLNIQKSSTFVVDLDSLQHPDDVKKDNFGVWTHSGSHDQKFESRINAAGNLEIGKSLFSTESGWEQFSDDFTASIRQTPNFEGSFHLSRMRH